MSPEAAWRAEEQKNRANRREEKEVVLTEGRRREKEVRREIGQMGSLAKIFPEQRERRHC